MNIAAVVLAGGIGKRFGADKPKQFLELSGVEIFVRSVELFHGSPLVASTTLVMHEKWIPEARKTLDRYRLYDVDIIKGGTTRQESVFNALSSLPAETDVVFIHDAARPLFPVNALPLLLNDLKPGIGTVAVSKIADTVYMTAEDKVKQIPDRSILRVAQTPQVFFLKEILKAHNQALARGIKDATDDVRIFLEAGNEVRTIEVTPWNIKITTAEDLELANILFEKTLLD